MRVTQLGLAERFALGHTRGGMIRSLMFTTVACVAILAEASALEWMRDLDAAGKKAAAESKLLLVEFTGSDWCKFCIAQKKNVLEQPEFVAWAEKYCVPVEIDVPNNAALVGGERQKRLNKFICDEFGVQSFPTLKVMTPEMVTVGGYSGAQSSPGGAIARLEKSFAAAKRLRSALKKDGAARTQALADIYRKLSEAERPHQFNLLRLLAESDSDNTTGLVPEYRRLAQIKRLQRGLAESLTAEERLNYLNREWENPEPGNEEALRRLKGQLLREQALQQSNNAQSVADILAARDAMIQSLEYTDNPQERFQLRHFIDTYYADPEALFLKQQKKR